MIKLERPIPLFYGVFITICLVWSLFCVFYYKNYLAGSMFAALIISGFLLHMFEKRRQNKRLDDIEKRFSRQEAKAWYYESIVTNSRDILFTTDLDHRIVKFNKGSEQTFGVHAFEVLGKHVNTLFESAENLDLMLGKVEEKGHCPVEELQIKNLETGEDAWLSVGISKLFDQKAGASRLHSRNPEFLGEIFTCKNVTQRRMLEEELKEKNEQLTKLSITDSLTNLNNVRHLKNEATRLQKIHHRYPSRPLSVALIDVDKFKEFNDNYGHLAGDKLLITLSEIIQMQIRKDLDSAFRYGGDEFVLMFPDTDALGSKIICDRILVDFLDHKLGSTSLSIGITEYQKDWGLLSVNLLVSKADEAMYMVKCRGGSGIHIFSTPLSDELAAREVIVTPNEMR
ncbi:MAG: diguanylate cyclase [Fibrobacteria bacterium]|nr:diguanylate cyclase [Fibrobacteria bacterium]